MEPGDTILYYNMDDIGIIGVVTSDPEWNKDHQGLAVKVIWMDDSSSTYESVETILSPDEDCEYMNLI